MNLRMKMLDKNKNLSMVPAIVVSMIYATILSLAYFFVYIGLELDRNSLPIDLSDDKRYMIKGLTDMLIWSLVVIGVYALLRKIWYKKWFRMLFVASFVITFLYVAFIFTAIGGIT